MHLKAILMGCCILGICVVAYGETLSSLPKAAAQMDVCRISKTTVLGKNVKDDITIRAVEIYLGRSTDISPRYRLLITYFHGAELNNTRTAFDLGNFWELTSYQRLKAGVYRISGTKLTGEGIVQKVVLTIDVAQVFIDDGKVKSPDFKNPYFLSTIQVKER